MTDIVELLRRGVDTNAIPDVTDRVMEKAADDIERLRHMYEAAHMDANAAIERQRLEIERLQAVLNRISALECGVLDPNAGLAMFEIARDIARQTRTG
jgi:hypothetical protein